MSETYKQKEYELKSAIDNINSIPYIFEDYVKETNSYIDRLLEETKEINVLRNIIKEVREYLTEEGVCIINKGMNENERLIWSWQNYYDLLEILKGEDNDTR